MQTLKTDNCFLLQADCSPVDLKPSWFQPDWLDSQGALVGCSSDSGRNPARFFRIEGQEFVLRHYWRGGLPGKILKDSYLFSGLRRSRPYRELALMEQMWKLGLPIARPVAALVCRQFGRYTGDLITVKLEESQDLVAALTGQALSLESWRQLGRTLAQFHLAGVYHADLNARNILLSRGSYYLIDFDRGEMRTPDSSWQQVNLQRLRRSLRKELGRVDNLLFDDKADWEALLHGYQETNAEASAN